MKALFAVTRTRGPRWNPTRALEEQEDWIPHAAFMNRLHAEGFVLLGGPLEETPDVLLIIRAEDAEEIRSRLAADYWTRNGLLSFKQIVPWTLRLGKIE
jgi:uncharacterized protein YciI